MENTCQNIQEQILELITGTLSAEKAAELRHHISRCTACSKYLKALQGDDKLLSDFVKVMQPTVAQLEQNVIDTLERGPSKKPVGSISIWRIILKSPLTKLAVAAVIIICVVMYLITILNQPQENQRPNVAALTKNKKASPMMVTSMIVISPPGPNEVRLDKNLDGERMNRRIQQSGWIGIGKPGLLWYYTGGTYLNFIQEDAFIYVSIDDGPLELAGVRLRALDDLDSLYFALIESEGPLALWCDIQPPMEISELPFLEKITSFQQVEPNALSDLAPLAHLPNLESVNIKARRKNLPHASIYSLPQIEDSSPLSSLTKLKVLTLSACFNITSISDLGTDLTYLDLSSCINISDMSFLTRLTNLTYLNLTDCGKVSDISPLAELTQLKHLDLGHCRNFSDLMPLSMLTHLTFLDLTGCKVADFLPVENLTSLETLDLTFCGNLSDLSPLKNLTSLRSLDLGGCHKLTDLWPLAELTSLEYLNLRACDNIPDLEALAGLTNLRKLDCLGCNQISDLSPLANLTNLKILNVTVCPGISDLWPLKGIIAQGTNVYVDDRLKEQLSEIRSEILIEQDEEATPQVIDLQ